MSGTVQSWDLVEHLFDASVAPERLERLIATWDAQMEQAGEGPARISGLAGSAFANQIAGVLQILEQLHAAELRRATDLLSSILGAAVVLAQDGTVVAANDAAARLFGLRPGGSVRALPLTESDLDAFEAQLGSVAAAGNGAREGILRCRPIGFDHAVVVHLRSMRADGSRPLVLAVTSELGWPPEVPATLARVFGLTPSEIDVVRQLTAGGTVAGIAATSARRAATVRSQLHAVLQKTGTATQAELLRLVILLLQSTTANVAP